MPRNVVAIIRMLFVEFVLELCLSFLHISRHQSYFRMKAALSRRCTYNWPPVYAG